MNQANMKINLIEETKEVFKCPYCETVYDDIYDARECAESCADIDDPIETLKTILRCPYCLKEFPEKLKKEAKAHMNKHEEEQDSFYNILRLKIAAEHPTQTKLNSLKL